MMTASVKCLGYHTLILKPAREKNMGQWFLHFLLHPAVLTFSVTPSKGCQIDSLGML